MAVSVPLPAGAVTVRARGDLVVWDIGEGPPVLVVHGFPDHPLGILEFARALAESGYRCIVPALPGYWPSAPSPDGDYSASSVGGDLLAVLDSFGLERVALVGHDWGAELGYGLTATHPERFSVFVALAVPHPTGYAIRHKEFAEMRTAWYATFLAYVPGAAVIASNPRWLTALAQSWSPGIRWAAWESVVAALGRDGVMDAVCAYYRFNLGGPPSRPIVEVPTTIIYGGQDGCITSNAHIDFSEYFPAGVHQILMSEVGHWPHVEAPDETMQLVLSALTAVEAW